MAVITLHDWYQLDFAWEHPLQDLLKIAAVMRNLKKEKHISKWFYLFERRTIRVRMKGRNKNNLSARLAQLSKKESLQVDNGLPFSDYQEGSEMLFNIDVVEAFANVMSEVSELSIKKLEKEIEFENYRVLERFQHCMFNNMSALKFKTEEHFLQQRLLERHREPFDKDFDI